MQILIHRGESSETSAGSLRGPDHYRAADHFYGARLPENVRSVARRGVAERHRFINGVFIHQWKVQKHDPERIKRGNQVFTRRAASLWAEYERRAAKLGEGPWAVEDKIIVDCRNFALLDASLLRSVGMPARIRNGFANYLGETHLQDHWICERWEGYRWISDDPDIQKTNVGENEFFSSVRAWGLARKDREFANRCGYGAAEGDRGLWAVLLGAVRDLAALDGFVCVSGDGWGLGVKKVEELEDADYRMLDDLCAKAYGNLQVKLPEGVTVPGRIGNYDYINGTWRELDWAGEA